MNESMTFIKERADNINSLRIFFLLFISFLLSSVDSTAQTYDDLVSLEGYKTKVYYSAGNDERAKVLAERMENVLIFYNKLIQYEPEVILLILNPADWSNFTDFPVYGMPHYNNDKTLIVASEDNDFWKSFIPPLDKLPKELAEKISATYVDKNGNLSMEAFFDLLAIHELGLITFRLA